MPDLAVLIPVLERPHRVVPVVDAFLQTCDCTVHFIADQNDADEIKEIKRDGRGRLLVKNGSYSLKINYGVEVTHEPLLFLGADDLEPQPGWFDAARTWLGLPDIEVVGVNDLLRRDRDHATHFLITRRYAEQPLLDGARGPLCEGYSHWYCDDELIATARHRGVYAYAESAHVKHLHYLTGDAPDDDTYRKGRSQARADGRRFEERSRLWTG